jgi:hypothetical protein
MACLKRAIGGIRSEHRHVGHTVADLKSVHKVAELIDFPDDIVAHYKEWAAGLVFGWRTPDGGSDKDGEFIFSI